MYDSTAQPRRAGRELGERGVSTPRYDALSRTRNLLIAFKPGLNPDRVRLLDALSVPLADHEGERLALRGWLLWSLDRHAEAVTTLEEAESQTQQSGENHTITLAAYWLARVRLCLRREAVEPYEQCIRQREDTPQSTAWLVDLLWRAGRLERAEPMWKSVRVNPRVLACDEGSLLDVRLHLRRGEFGQAEKRLREMTPHSGPLAAERHLLLAWLRPNERSAEQLALAEACPYPASALASWRNWLELRTRGALLTRDNLPPGWREWVEAQQRRAGGQPSAHLYRAAGLPLARYGLVVQGEERAADLVPLVGDAFFGQRLRAWQAIERFCSRELSSILLVEMLSQVERAGYRCAAMEHFKRLAQGQLDDLNGPPGPMRDNAVRLALERGDDPAMLPLSDAVRPALERETLRRTLIAGHTDGPAARLFTANVRELAREHPALSRCLDIYDAACRGETATVVALFEAHHGPLPRFVLAAVQALMIHRPSEAKTLARWVEMPTDAPAAWWLHQAARLLVSGDALGAYGVLEKTDSDIRPAVRRLAEADAVTRTFPAANLKPERLLGLVDGLHAMGVTDLLTDTRAKLDAVTEAPRDVRHALAILYGRSLDADQLDPINARRVWGHWLAIDPPPMVIAHLLGWHRAAIVAGLAQGRLEAARRHWEVLHAFEALKEALAAFRDALATEYLVSTRDAMRLSDAPPGFRADYERGLTLLRRLLSLDRDNVRLLTAIIDICAEWFLDFYTVENLGSMAEQVARHRPLADHLARLIAERPGELSSRAALSEFAKFRGFVEQDRDNQLRFYREALKWNPHNDNVRQLLSDMGADDEP